MIFKNLKTKQNGENKKNEDKPKVKNCDTNGWLLCFTFLFLLSIVCTIVIPFIVWSEYLFRQNENNGKCSYNYQNGICLANSYCCDGQYAIGSGLCSGSALCCLGNAKQCNDARDNETMWSFQSITAITSIVVARNASEPVVEQAIVIAVSAIEEYVYYSDVSENVGKELSATTGQQWFAIVGDRKTFEIFLPQFRAYIAITIKDIEIMLFQINSQLSASISCDNKTIDDNQTEVFGVDTLPAIDILRNEIVDKGVQSFVTQTIDYVLHSCESNANDGNDIGDQRDYSCVADNVVKELNEQYASNDWQCIVSGNGNELTTKIDYIGGSLFDALFSHTHRVIVYKINNAKQMSNKKILLKARRAIKFNRTVVIESHLNDENNTEAMKLVNSAVNHYTSYWSLCKYLAAIYTRIYGTNWVCVAGRDGSFSAAIFPHENYIELNMDYLRLVLFQRN